MAKLRLACSSSTFIIFFFLISLSYSLASTSGDIPEATTDVAPRDTTPYDDLIVLPSSQTIPPISESDESSSDIPVIDHLIPVDLTEVKEEKDDFPGSVPLKEIPPFHHHRHHHRPGRLGRKEIPHGNDMTLSSHESFGNPGFEEDDGFGGEDGGLRKFHHRHHHHHHHSHFDDGEVEGVEDEREGHPHGPSFHQRGFGGEEEHPPFHHGFHGRHHRHHHRHHHEEGEEGGLLFKLRKFLNGF